MGVCGHEREEGRERERDGVCGFLFVLLYLRERVSVFVVSGFFQRMQVRDEIKSRD